MNFQPGQELDKDSSDPLNPTVNYTHFHPSPEQQDPRVPLGFKIYGIGCLAAFVIFLFLVVIYVIFFKQIRRFKKGTEEKVNRSCRNLGKPSLPNLLEDGLEIGASSEKNVIVEANPRRPPTCTSSSYEGENVRCRRKPRDMGSWDSSATMVDADSPRIPPTSHLPDFNGASPRKHSMVFSCNTLVPVPTSVPRLDSPISPKTMPNYISPAEPRKAMIAEWAHRPTESPRRSVTGKGNDFNQEKLRAGSHMIDAQTSPLMGLGRNPGSPPKGILKTSPTYVARNSLSHLPSQFDGYVIPTSAENEGNNDAHLIRSSSTQAKLIAESSKPGEKYSSNDGKQSPSSHHEASSFSSGMPSIGLSSTPESYIVHLGPNPKQPFNGPSGTSRRVSISVPSRNDISFVPSPKSALMGHSRARGASVTISPKRSNGFYTENRCL